MSKRLLMRVYDDWQRIEFSTSSEANIFNHWGNKAWERETGKSPSLDSAVFLANRSGEYGVTYFFPNYHSLRYDAEIAVSIDGEPQGSGENHYSLFLKYMNQYLNGDTSVMFFDVDAELRLMKAAFQEDCEKLRKHWEFEDLPENINPIYINAATECLGHLSFIAEWNGKIRIGYYGADDMLLTADTHEVFKSEENCIFRFMDRVLADPNASLLWIKGGNDKESEIRFFNIYGRTHCCRLDYKHDESCKDKEPEL